MRIERVDATAFGALRSRSLDLSPSFTVVHGPNEAGKSTWFAATYAGLVGRRVSRGRGTRAQVEFRRRHKPWSGSQWSAGVVVVLDSGRRLQISNDLLSGEATIKDLQSGRLVPAQRLERELGLTLQTEGGFDGARLLGLNRDSARSTMFVGQADILAVLRNADELQEFLQRASTSTVADTTAEQALASINELRSTQVGSTHVGNRPLRATAAAYDAARDHHANALDARHRLRLLRSDVARLDAQVAGAERNLTEIDRIREWMAIDELDARIARAMEWSSRVAALRSEGAPADEELITRVTAAVEGFRSRGEEPQPPAGADVAALEAELAGLPELPDGPRKPEPAVVSALRALDEAEAALRALRAAGPMSAPDASKVALGSDQLRALADHLGAEEPPEPAGLRERVSRMQAQWEADRRAHAARRAEFDRAASAYADAQAQYNADLSAYHNAMVAYEMDAQAHHAEWMQHESARQQWEASRGAAPSGSGRALVITGGVLAGLGVVLSVLGLFPVGIPLLILGLAFGIPGLVLRRKARRGADAAASDPQTFPPMRPQPQPPAPPTPPQPFLTPNPGDPPPAPEGLGPALNELDRWTAAVEAVHQRREHARAEIERFELEPDAEALRALARAIEDQDAAAQRLAEHERRLAEATTRFAESSRGLSAALGQDATEDAELARRAFEEYQRECEERDRVAREADRRADLERALDERRQREDDFARAREVWLAGAAALRAESAALGLTNEDGQDPLALLDQWLQAQRRLASRRAEADTLDAKLGQLLDGSTIEQLHAERDERAGAAGERPDPLRPVTEDQRRGAESHRDDLRAARATTLGQLRETEKALSPIPEAIEAEAQAEAASRVVRQLDRTLALAQQHLEIAKDRAHADIAPVLAGTIRPWVPQVTGGRFVDVEIDAGTLMVRAVESGGRPRDADVLSHGTMEQLFLLLRIALASHLATTDETAPLILDDITVQSDRDRTLAILELLQELSATRQVVLFTQEVEVIEWAQAHLEPNEVIAL